jgi:hypothetical protein
MRKLILQVVRYAFDTTTGTWSSTPSVISDAYDVNVGFRVGELNDTFDFKVDNTNNLNINNYNVQDKITIHFLLNGDTYSNSNMIINGMVKEINEVINERGKILEITGVSFGEITTTGLVFATSINKNVMQHLNTCLESIRLRNSNFNIEWDSNNPTVKSDGTSFPALNGGGEVRDYDKSLNKLLEKYLIDEYTEDGNYYWYVSTDNKLVIRKRTITTTSTLTEGTDNIISAKFEVDASKIYNFIVVKCGKDPKGRPISTKYDDPVSRAKYGFKYYMLIDETIASDLLEKERANGSFAQDSNYPNSYPYTVTWKDSTGSAITVNSDTEFTEEFRLEVKRRGKGRGRDYAVNYSEKLIKASIVMVPTNTFTIASMIACTFPSYNISNKNMRCIEIQYSDENTLLILQEEVAS